MDVATRRKVVERAGDACEYCRLPQSAAPFLTFHIEHVQAQQHVLDDSLDNLALACPDCNRHKGPNLTTLSEDRTIVCLFHPRLHLWCEHFQFQGPLILGKSEIGTATVRLLQMNGSERVMLRAKLISLGEM